MSQKIVEIREQLKTSNARLLSVAKQQEAKPNLGKRDYAMLALWEKLLNNSVAILLLIENDLKEEAIAIQRLSLEHLFNLFAMARNDTFHDEFLNSSQNSIVKGMKSLHRSIGRREQDSLTPENRERLESAIEFSEKNPIEFLGYSIYNAANKSELGPLYDSLYRSLSLSHAHSTAISILTKAPEDHTEILGEVISSLSLAYGLSFEVWAE